MDNLILIKEINISIDSFPADSYNLITDENELHIKESIIDQLNKESSLIRSFINENKNHENNENSDLSIFCNTLIFKRFFFNYEASTNDDINEAKLNHFLQISQCIRLLTRYEFIQNSILKINHNDITNVLSITLANLTQLYSNYVIYSSNHKIISLIELCLIEIVTIIKRFIIPKTDVLYNISFIQDILNSTIVDNMISLVSTDNFILNKLLHTILFHSKYLNNENRKILLYNIGNIDQYKDLVMRIILKLMNKNLLENIPFSYYLVDYLIEVLENIEASRDYFILKNGFDSVLSSLKIIYDNKGTFSVDAEKLLTKLLFLIQIIFKYKESLKEDYNIKLIDLIFNFAFDEIFYNRIVQSCYNTLSSIALCDQLNHIIKEKYLLILLKSFINNTIDYCYNNSSNLVNKNIHKLQSRLLRIIYSLEKNKKVFKMIFPSNLLSAFIDIGNYKPKLNSYDSFIQTIQSFPKQDLTKIINHMQ